MKKNDSDLIRYTLSLPIDLHTRFKTQMSKERRSMSETIITFINSYLEKASKYSYIEDKESK